jgi:transposase
VTDPGHQYQTWITTINMHKCNCRQCTNVIDVGQVRDLFGVSYHPDHIGKILHGLRFSVQYPGKNLSKADEKAQQTWRLEELPAIKKKAKRNEA